MKILLALSGGGFRATIFHMGVMRCLRDLGLLGRVSAISSVSGGSIVAAHLVLNWRDYNGSLDSFQRQERTIRAVTRFGLRNRLARRDLIYSMLNWLHRWRGAKTQYTITDRLRDYYRSELFGENDTLGALRIAMRDYGAPRLFLMTTNLSQPTAQCFFGEEGFVVGSSTDSHKVTLDAFPIAAAVACSSCFPLLFPPMRLSATECNVPQSAFELPPQYLTDGGVYENLGVTALREHAATLNEKHVLVVSNAGAKLDWDFETGFTQKRVRSILRSVEIVQYWAEQRLRMGDDSNEEVVIDIADVIDPAQYSGFPDREVQRQCAMLRTDLDRFSDTEWTALYNHGYSVARKQLQQVIKSHPELAAPPDSTVQNTNAQPAYNPWQNTAANLRRILARGARRRLINPFVAVDGYSLWNPLAFLLLSGLALAAAYFGYRLLVPEVNSQTLSINQVDAEALANALWNKDESVIGMRAHVSFTGIVDRDNSHLSPSPFMDIRKVRGKGPPCVVLFSTPLSGKGIPGSTVIVVGRVAEDTTGNAQGGWVIVDPVLLACP